jgi:hypothetical protein
MDQNQLINENIFPTWNEFNKLVRAKGCNLLKRLDEFPNSVLVTGCQRSGTTILARVITQSKGMVNYWFGQDDELDAALILSGSVDHQPRGRYCFQTTYVNECYQEYFEHRNGHKIIWVLRNPYSVIFSMLYNWRNTPNRLFEACGIPILSGIDKWLFTIFGHQVIPMLRKACWGYNGKTSQVFNLISYLGSENVLVVDYDDLVIRKDEILPEIYAFIDLDYKKDYSCMIHSKSLSKMQSLSRHEYSTIKSLCEPVYQRARRLLIHA